MRQEIARILNLVIAMLVIAALWALATMRASDAPSRPEPNTRIQIRNEPSHA